MINIWCKIIARFDLKSTNTIDSMKDSKIPVLFAHGEDDDFIPPFNSKINYKSYNGPKKILLVKKAAHGISYLVKPELYVKTIKDFLKGVK